MIFSGGWKADTRGNGSEHDHHTDGPAYHRVWSGG